jgi:hypothetical protein
MTVPNIQIVPVGVAVPKTIHQIFFSSGAMPDLIRQNIEKIKNLNPGWEYRQYGEKDMTDFIESVYGAEVLGYFHRISRNYGASRADFFRYLLMYKCGGVYLDIKSSPDTPFDQILRGDDVFLLSRWRNADGQEFEGWGVHQRLKSLGGQEFQQWHIITAPGHPFLRAVIERVMQNIDSYNPVLHGTGKTGVLWVAGPIAYTMAIAPILHEHPHRVVDSYHDLNFRYSIFNAPNIAHKTLFAKHYTQLKVPVIELQGGRKLAWIIFRPIQNFVLIPIGRVVSAIQRRVARLRVAMR